MVSANESEDRNRGEERYISSNISSRKIEPTFG
jgi:hypothetical protein